MIKKLIFICAALTATVGAAQPLTYNNKGEFKIVQITDVHFKNGDSKSDVALQLFDEIIKEENPDLVLFTGDIVVEPAPVLEGWKRVISPFQKAGIPFAVVLGNHDDEHSTSREEINAFLSKEPYSLTKTEDYELEIFNSNGEIENVLYMFDSHSYSTNKNVDGYGWIKHSQISEYISKSQRYSNQNGGNKLASLAFFHIPLPEYREAYYNIVYPAIGDKGEEVCSAQINSGMFAAMVEMGDMIGCFVGHDHVNDYISYKNGIALAYGRFSGGKTTYGDLRNGCRVITLRSGRRGFESYIRERGGAIVNRGGYPRKLRFGITADTHFDMPPESDQYKNVMALNSLNLDGVAIVGDIFDHQHSSIIELFKSRYERGDGDSTLNTNLYIGLGNHDINPVSNDSIANLKERNITLNYVDNLLDSMKRLNLIKNLHLPTRNYSFNLNGIHFIQTHTFAGDNTLGSGGLKWLREDLKRNGSNGEPIILLMHYTFNDSERWINNREKENLANELENYNILAIFNGHDHTASVKKWHGIDVYTADNVWKDDKLVDPSFYLLEYDSIDGLEVKRCYWDNETLKVTVVKID